MDIGMKLALQWSPETIQRGADNHCGARLIQLTSAALISHDIYCEERYTTADGSRLAFLRSPTGAAPEELWVCDLRSFAVARVSDSIHGFPTSPLFRDTLFYISQRRGTDRALMRLDLKTLEQEEVFDLGPCPKYRYSVCTVSPDERYFVSNLRVDRNTWGLYRADLSRGTWEVFHQHQDICNPHPQFEPAQGQDILVQLNRGCVVDEEENFSRLVGDEGATLYLINRDGGNYRPLPVGKPHTGPVSGHECWVGATGQVILTTCEDQGNEIHLVAPGDARSRRLWRGVGRGVAFMHIAASNDGRYFIVDDLANGKLYVGSIATARLLPLCDTGASCARAQYTHPHAYLTPDHRYVIFNSDRTGLGQVWAAELPAGFLDALDLPNQ
jgi:hypothetical protein